MADFTLYEGDWGENKISVLPQLKKDRLIDLQMYLVNPKSENMDDTEEFILPFKYEDVFLLREYLSSVLNLFDKINSI